MILNFYRVGVKRWVSEYPRCYMNSESFHKEARVAQKSEECEMGALLRKQPGLGSEVTEGGAWVPRKDTETKFDLL